MKVKTYRVWLKASMTESNGDTIPAGPMGYTAFKATRLGRTYYIIPFVGGQLAVRPQDLKKVTVEERS